MNEKNSSDPELPDELETEAKPTHIVGIGASAGGLEAIEAFFKVMPPDSGVSFVVIQHLSPDHKSLMAELLSKRTRMPVHRAEDGVLVEPNSVYLIPPNKNLRLFHGRIILSEQDRDARGINLPIDIFFRSLAEDQGAKAIAIVLSGTGSDGTSGIRAIKEELGMVMVQVEETAAFDGMPRSAIATGLVDYILPPNEMPTQLLSYLKHPFTAKDEYASTMLNDEDGVTRIFALLRESNKIDFTYYKPTTIIRRIERRMAVNQIHDLSDYVRFLESYPVELNSLHKDLLIGVTSFFRDPEAFDAINEKYLPQLLKEAKEDKLRIWVSGCSTGEEAYSLAILCCEVMEQQNLALDVKIFATDVDREAILAASAGVFAESAVADIEPGMLSKYFYRRDEGFYISRQVREMVVFAQHNLVKDPPFTNIDLISCRNLLIYLQPVLQKRVLELFNFALNPKGILFLGSSETTGEMGEYFDPVDHKWRIYQSRGRRRQSELSEPAINFDAKRWYNNNRMSGRGMAARIHEEERLLERLVEGVAGDYLPFCLVVSESLELMHVAGDAKDYLQFTTGKVVNDVSKLVIKDLAIPLSTGLQKVFKSKEELIYSNINLNLTENHKIVNMRLKPLPTKKRQAMMVAVFIEEVRTATQSDTSSPETYNVGKEAQQRIIDLENELQFTRENLQATVEELETSNEELQATNEELLASNEELQSTNEELQSVNEELYTVNSEYQGKITELTEVNNDLDNLLCNTRVATLFLDENLDIRRYTPEATQLFRIIDQDIGRPISHLSHRLLNVDLVQLAKDVLINETGIEREKITTETGEEFFMRVFPYQIAPDTYSGVVFTFVSTSGLRKAQNKLVEQELRMEALLRVSDAYVLINEQGKIQEVNQALIDLVGYDDSDLIDQNISILMSDDHAAQHDHHIQRYLKEGNSNIIGKTREVPVKRKDGEIINRHLTVAEMVIGHRHWFVGLLKTQ
ncbi:MAG: PAS domain-containing protein [Candidatus Thiodiazotropha taylori]|nr:PAS domain-containing protein [Candidatus Thiodiazotropha taylori]